MPAWQQDSSAAILELLSPSTVDLSLAAEQLLAAVPHSFAEMADTEFAVRQRGEAQQGSMSKRRRLADVPSTTTTAAEGQEGSARRGPELAVQLGYAYIVRKLKELYPECCWHFRDTSASGLQGRQGLIDLSFLHTPLAVWAQLLFYGELKQTLQPISAQHTAIGQLIDRSMDVFAMQPEQRQWIFGIAAGSDAVQVLCMRKGTTPLRTALEPFAFSAESAGLRLLLAVLLAPYNAHGFVQAVPPAVNVPGCSLVEYHLVDYQYCAQHDVASLGQQTSRTSVRSSQVWQAKCVPGDGQPSIALLQEGACAADCGSDGAFLVAVKLGQLGHILHEVRGLLDTVAQHAVGTQALKWKAGEPCGAMKRVVACMHAGCHAAAPGERARRGAAHRQWADCSGHVLPGHCSLWPVPATGRQCRPHPGRSAVHCWHYWRPGRLHAAYSAP
jgi:hypothetical protein